MRSRTRTRSLRVASVAAAVLAGVAGAAAPTVAATPAAARHAATVRSVPAVFAQSDNPAGNTVVAYSRAADGSLRQAGVYPTGGLGGVLPGSVVDHTASQSALTLDRAHGLLYAVNAGSDTLTVFRVAGDRLARVQVISTRGSFPVSVTAEGDRVFVLNARAGGSVQGFLRIGDRLVAQPAGHRELNLGTDDTTVFTGTPAQIGFTPDASALVITTKGAGNAIDVYPFGPFGLLPARPVVNSEPGAVPFGFAFDSAGRLAVTLAGPGTVATYTVGRDGRVTLVGATPTGQAATCWLTTDGDLLYSSNAGSGTLSGFRDTGADPVALGTTATDPGTVDAAVSGDGRFLYAQTGAAGTIDAFRLAADGTLTAAGTVTVPAGAGGEGIAAS